MKFMIDIDTGGTFTDGFFAQGNRVKTVKVQTTPHDLTVCFFDCVKAGAKQFEVSIEDMLVNTEVIRFSTTIGTNTLIERNGTRIGLLVSFGSPQDQEIRGKEGEESPLLFPGMVRTLKGTIAEDGGIAEDLDREEVLRASQELLDEGARCLVVSLANSAHNPVHEQQVRSLIKEEYPRDYLGSVPVYLASDITNLAGGQERTNTAVVNAYIHSRLVKFLYKACEDLRKRFYMRPLLIVHATGGVSRVAKTRAINTYNSGPAAGLMGVASLGRLYGMDNLVSGDMGGTSFDMGVVRKGRPRFTLQPEIEGLRMAVPMVEIRAIGAGGGSIASVKGGDLLVGPQSAGALPGPACFSLGGTNPTVTDADVVLGYIDPAYYLGGRIKLDPDKAAEVINESVASPLGMPLLEAALAIRDKVDANMGNGLKGVIVSAEAEFDPVLVIYGGAGPTHCCGLAEHAGLKKIIVPKFASVFSARSLSNMDIHHIYSRRLDIWLKRKGVVDGNAPLLKRMLESMQMEAARDMRGEGFSEDAISYFVEFFLSQGGNLPEGRIIVKGFDLSSNLATALKKQAPKLAGIEDIFSPIAFLHASSPVPHFETTKPEIACPSPEKAIRGTRPVCWRHDDGFVETRTYDRMKLLPGNVVDGPAIIEAPDTTYLVRSGWRFAVDAEENAIFQEVK